MATYSIDTAKAIDSLIESGMPESQAKAVVATFSKSQEQLATKADIQELTSKLEGSELKFDGRFDAIDGKFDAIDGRFEAIEGKFGAVEGKFEAVEGTIKGLEGKIDGLRSQITTRALLVGASMVTLLKALEYLGL